MRVECFPGGFAELACGPSAAHVQERNVHGDAGTHAINYTVVPDGLVRTLLLFGTVPRISIADGENLPLNQKLKFKAVAASRNETESNPSQSRFIAVSKHRVGTNYFDSSSFIDGFVRCAPF